MLYNKMRDVRKKVNSSFFMVVAVTLKLEQETGYAIFHDISTIALSDCSRKPSADDLY